jgi:hypothetical protein
MHVSLSNIMTRRKRAVGAKASALHIRYECGEEYEIRELN